MTDRTLPDPAVEPTIKPPRVAAILNIALRTTYAAIERGDIPSIRVGRTVRIPTRRFLEQFGLTGDPPRDQPEDGVRQMQLPNGIIIATVPGQPS